MDADVECPDAAPLPIAAAAVDEGVAEGAWWAQWNKTQRTKAKQFLRQEPTGTLVVATVTLQLSSHVLHIIERVASEDFAQRQQWEKLQGHRGCFRVSQLCSDRLARQTLSMAESLLEDAGKYAALPALHRTWQVQGLGFVLISSAVAAMEYYLFRPWRDFPFCIFELISSDSPCETTAQAILDKPACLRDSWSSRFLQRFNSVALLGSRRCRAVLHAMASALKLDIIALECRHASVRKLQRNRSATHVADIADVSAEFMLQCFRRLESLFAVPTEASKQPQLMKTKQKKKKVVGGGTQRCCVADVLKEQHELPKEMRLKQRDVFVLANQRLRQMKAEGGAAWQDLQRRGRQMQLEFLARKAGGVPPKKKRPMSVQSGGVLKQSRSLLSPGASRSKSAADVLHAANLQEASGLAEEALSSWKSARLEEESAKQGVARDLAEWRREVRPDCPICPDVPRLMIPAGPAEKDLHLKEETFLPPVHDSIRAVMDNSVASSKATIHSQLQHFWCLTHVPIKHSASPPARLHSSLPALGKTSLCCKLGFCTCRQSHRNEFASAISAFLRKLWAKNSRSRMLMDARRGVLCLESSTGRWWWHVAYCNRKYSAYMLLELQAAGTHNVLHHCLPSNALLLTTRPFFGLGNADVAAEELAASKHQRITKESSKSAPCQVPLFS